jgi:hypothetical protein
MKKFGRIIIPVMLSISLLVFILAFVALIYGDELANAFNVIGIRVATLIVAFASFGSSSLFSMLILLHNKTVTQMNDDTNRRAELFRELQFASSNYSIIEFMDRMLIYPESTRYVERFIHRGSGMFHMIESNINEVHLYEHPEQYVYLSIKIPFRVVEGKTVSMITFDRLKFERDQTDFIFDTPKDIDESKCFLLYNEHTKRNNVIINLITKKDSLFFDTEGINAFSKIKIHLNITSLLGVKVKGVSELYFTNPLQIEGDGTNTYKINSANFTLIDMPKIMKQ